MMGFAIFFFSVFFTLIYIFGTGFSVSLAWQVLALKKTVSASSDDAFWSGFFLTLSAVVLAIFAAMFYFSPKI